ncbi:MAG: AmmeMemoRadiSam system protein B [Verrucomicrobia bacterium]|jgi:hypothetical protein|nr:AmmeMemoRadiSam system protein B [Verrucomicrobiota bacterium]OQC62982.1 MAG: hypothetical protein BWX48_03467 [Verrucomicrobia bacterium ADurb.Bin006]MDI9382058.1 AmmeMemoRadiSam system protein B [Verrucomicrobiota bacterium]NMD21241.1 AmmeMemoRadiSam system protein B [Verrucomicrobiota bacterium]HNU99367.1 AmmeMemoRadiSam system protein B [Verrucomicrobiota bacterium]
MKSLLDVRVPVRARRRLAVAACIGSLSAVWHSPQILGASSAPADASNQPARDAAFAPARIREPAVAGLFYPAEAGALSSAVDRLLARARPEPVPNLKALICPHAGYQFSGPTAAHGYKLLGGHDWRTVVVLAPSHYARFKGASVVGASAFRTPLGDVRVSSLAARLARTPPFGPERPCPVQRPAWAGQSSRPSPARGQDTPHSWEHADEVQVPFLQRALKDFEIVTVILGEVDAAEVARGLAGHLDEHTLVVASSDLSHYHPYDQAKALDTRCVKAVCDLDLDGMLEQEACGRAPILALMHLARQKGWKAKLMDYRNSGDTGGDKSGVVGYASIAFTGEAEGSNPYSIEERRRLIELARQAVREAVTTGRSPSVNAEDFPPSLREPKGSFVTLTQQGALRGCIGNLRATEPLYASIISNARSAATRDYRFPPVRKEELDSIEFEISILSDPKPLDFTSPEDLLAKLQPHRDGVVLEIGSATSTFLPQVWRQLPDKVQFLSALAKKADRGPDDWRKPGTRVLVYRVEAFKESELKQ